MNQQIFHRYREFAYRNGSQNFTADVGYGETEDIGSGG